MRLRRLDLTRYGKFTDQAIDFGPAQAGVPDLHIIYGLNEAGKSTALSAYLDLLFGIENTSRYGFLHPYPNMQVGARLDFGGAEHELVRVKARVNSLLDRKNQPINEALLSVPLAGLTRESYRSMFSLDDQSLEDGGNAIIASKGELGELLFAASAGLADLGTILTRVRDEADTIYKQRGRTTHIAELKRALGELKTQQDAIDTRASTHAALAAALKQAETAYAEAMHNRSLAKVRHEEIARILRAAPSAAEHRRLSAEVAAFGELPEPPAEWAGQVSGLMIKSAELDTQIAGTQADIARLDEDIAALVVDQHLLAQGATIAGLAESMARFATAEADLPRRHAAIAEDEAAITAILKGLGQDREVAPESLLLPASLVGTLRDLIEARSGIEARAETARSELAQARDSLERAMREIETETGSVVIDEAQLGRVNEALGALRRSDHQARIRLAERAMPAVSRRYESMLDGLGHWSGDGDDLRAVGLPEPRQVDRWRLAAGTIDRRRSEQSDKLRELTASQREHKARITAIHATAGAIDDAAAVRLRAARDAAWSAHGATLDASTAAAFAAALQADDAVGAARLAHVQDLAELRNLQQGLAVIESGLHHGNEVLVELEAENTALAQEIRVAINERIHLPEGASVTLWLEQLESWMRRRLEVLAAWQVLEETRADLASAKTDLAHDLAILGEAMTQAGFEAVDELPPDALMQAAETALTQVGSQQAIRAAREKSLRERESDVLLRERVLAEAMAALKNWQQDWAEAVGQTWFIDTGVGAVREVLRLLNDLPAALTQRNARARQIETMARDQKEFTEQLRSILIALGEQLDNAHVLEAARSLSARHLAAVQAHRLHNEKTAERDRLAKILRHLTQDLELQETRKREMTAFFGVETLEDVNARIAQAAERKRLRQQLDAVTRQLTAELRTETVDAALAQLDRIDLAQSEREAVETAARLEDLEATSRQRFAEHARAQERLDAIGGDDAVARIEAQRRTVLLQIQDKAMDYLRLKTGALLAEKALRAYREQHRSSMMDQASRAFALITKGEYSGLAAQPEKDRETLIGLPRQGGSKLAADMSKGTQFQLYLALRLAGYQEFARSRPSVPFIADDIMETFDEPRSEQVFRLLGEMGHIGQVIYLTHHRHLCDIARTVVPSVTVHELKS